MNFSHRERLVVMSGLATAMFLAALDQTIVAVALPRIASELPGGENVSWIVSAYLLASTAVTPIYGKLSDFYGRKRSLQTAIVVFLVGSVLCGLASSMLALIAARALQGIGGGGLLSMSHATVADIVSPRERGRYQAYFSGAYAAANVLGPIVGGLFTDSVGWRWVFWINLPVGLATLAVVHYSLRRLAVPGLRRRIDWAGAALVVGAVTAVLLITTLGGHELPWTSPWIGGLAAAALTMTGLLVVQERTVAEPILPPRLFRNPVFRVANATSAVMSVGVLGAIVYLPLMLQRLHGMSAHDSGLMLMPLTAAIVAGAMFAGRRVARTGRYKIYPILGLVVATAAMLGLAFLDAASSALVTGTVMAAAGFGMGMCYPVLLVAVQNAVDPEDLGAGTASVSFFRSLGGAFGVALFGAVLGASFAIRFDAVPGHEALGTAETVLHQTGAVTPAVMAALHAAFRDMLLMAAALLLLGALLATRLKQLPLRGGPAQRPTTATEG